MSHVAYVNGLYVPHSEAAVHIEDRGFQFADGIYEVIAIYKGRMIDADDHFDRLARSLGEIGMSSPMTRGAMKMVIRELIRRSRVRRGALYIQVTRGTAKREFPFPKDTPNSLVMTIWQKPADDPHWRTGVPVITVPDIRWKRCDIKSVALLPAVLCKQMAVDAGAYEAWMVDADGHVTEGSSSNAWIVNADGNLQTRDTDSAILGGITRLALLELAEQASIRIVKKPFSVDQAKAAREAFMSSSTAFVKPIVSIDGQAVGDGKPGPLTQKLIRLYADHLDAA